MGKRLIDLLLAMVCIALFWPLFVMIGLSIASLLGRPVFFRQVRPGRHGRPFEMLKFRTMRDLVGPDGVPLPDGERMTSLGRVLRATSLDELPEIWNVLRGDMSFVGPRPLLLKYLPLYSPEQARRHEVRPGITGWAQVNGRNLLNWEDRFRLDVWYVDNQSLWLDLKILLLTAKKVLLREGINADGEATMSEFKGNP